MKLLLLLMLWIYVRLLTKWNKLKGLKMSQESENNKRVAKNTLLLYLRMFMMTCVSLYTSRIMLEALGVENMGLYNVVGGVVGLMSILNGAMTVSTQRYLSFGLGQGNSKNLAQVFTTCFTIYVLLCAILLMAAETMTFSGVSLAPFSIQLIHLCSAP